MSPVSSAAGERPLESRAAGAISAPFAADFAAPRRGPAMTAYASAFASPADFLSTASTLARLEKIARLLDMALVVPGTRIRFGLDALADLAPIVGPLLTLGPSAYIVLEAWRLGAPKALLARMAANVALDAAIGTVPVAGWAADLLYRANVRNIALLRRHFGERA